MLLRKGGDCKVVGYEVQSTQVYAIDTSGGTNLLDVRQKFREVISSVTHKTRHAIAPYTILSAKRGRGRPFARPYHCWWRLTMSFSTSPLFQCQPVCDFRAGIRVRLGQHCECPGLVCCFYDG